jgi:hypothetical protein
MTACCPPPVLSTTALTDRFLSAVIALPTLYLFFGQIKAVPVLARLSSLADPCRQLGFPIHLCGCLLCRRQTATNYNPLLRKEDCLFPFAGVFLLTIFGASVIASLSLHMHSLFHFLFIC